MMSILQRINCFKNNKIRPIKIIQMLGLKISSNLSWKPHIQQIANSASAKLGFSLQMMSGQAFTPDV